MRALTRPRLLLTVVGVLVLSLAASACAALSNDTFTVNAEFARTGDPGKRL
jgi:hypothetical protein